MHVRTLISRSYITRRTPPTLPTVTNISASWKVVSSLIQNYILPLKVDLIIHIVPTATWIKVCDSCSHVLLLKLEFHPFALKSRDESHDFIKKVIWITISLESAACNIIVPDYHDTSLKLSLHTSNKCTRLWISSEIMALYEAADLATRAASLAFTSTCFRLLLAAGFSHWLNCLMWYWMSCRNKSKEH